MCSDLWGAKFEFTFVSGEGNFPPSSRGSSSNVENVFEGHCSANLVLLFWANEGRLTGEKILGNTAFTDYNE